MRPIFLSILLLTIPSLTASPANADTPDVKNTLVPNMVDIAETTFQMGRALSQKGESDELPRHPVTLSPYQIGKYEITNSQYVAVLNWALEKGYLSNTLFKPFTQATSDAGPSPHYRGRLLIVVSKSSDIIFEHGTFKTVMRDGMYMDDHPVVDVTWYGAIAYANWLSEIQGLTPCYSLTTFTPIDPRPNGYRLPTEAEWERAAGWNNAGEEVTWHYAISSDAMTEHHGNFQLNNPLEKSGLDSYPYTSPIGYFDGSSPERKRAISPAGCFDMSGNVQEWCEDWFGAYKAETQFDPTGFPKSPFKVVRGGAWNSMKNSCRTTNRGWTEPYNHYRSFGFRIARSLPKE
ncbi:MAG: formylglycine-generating enzyme family protein [Candidatus Hydrogenedentota bacterium]